MILKPTSTGNNQLISLLVRPNVLFSFVSLFFFSQLTFDRIPLLKDMFKII